MRPAVVMSIVLSTLPPAAPWVGAQTQPVRPVVRASLDPPGPVAVGQPVSMAVDILVPTFFMQPPALPAIEVPNALATLEDGAVNMNDRVDGEVWSGIRRVYRIVPQAQGLVSIPAVPVVVHYAIGGRLSDPFTVPTPPLSFTARIPAGAEGLDYFFAARDLRLTERFDRRPSTLKVGDAFTRTMTLEAPDVPALSLPPVPLSAPDGVSMRADPPSVSTVRGERGAPDRASSVERATYTATRAGHYVLPEVTVRYWNPAASRVDSVGLPAISFDVAAGPAFGEEIALPPDPAEAAAPARPSWMSIVADWWRVVVAATVTLLAIVWLVRRFGGRARASWAAARRARAESESHYFAMVKAAARRGDLAALHAAALAWLARLPASAGTPTLSGVAAASGDTALAADIDELNRALYAAPGQSAPIDGLATRVMSGLGRVRRHLLARGHPGSPRHDRPLVPLNPS